MKRVWHVGQGDDAENFFASHQDGRDMTDTATGGVLDSAFERDVACLVILRRLGDVPFEFLMAHRNHLRRMWEFPHELYSANSTFSKATVPSSLAKARYNGQVMHDYI